MTIQEYLVALIILLASVYLGYYFTKGKKAKSDLFEDDSCNDCPAVKAIKNKKHD